MGFEKGHKLATGRPKGALNTLTATVKDTVLAVFNDLQTDPQANLLTWAKGNPTTFYLIASKLIPTEVNQNVKKIVINVTLPDERDSSKLDELEQDS